MKRGKKDEEKSRSQNVVSKFDSFHLLSYNLFYFLGFLHSFNIYFSFFFLLFILYFYIQYWYFKWRWRLTVYLVLFFRNAYHCVQRSVLYKHIYQGIIQLLGAIEMVVFSFSFYLRLHFNV